MTRMQWFLAALACAWAGAAPAPRQRENLGRSVVAVNLGGGQVYVSWRLLGTNLSPGNQVTARQ